MKYAKNAGYDCKILEDAVKSILEVINE